MEFKYDVRDLKFILKEWLATEEVLACDRYKENFSMDDIDMLLNECYKVAKESSTLSMPGDKIGVKFENSEVQPSPDSKKPSILQQNGWGSSVKHQGLNQAFLLSFTRHV